MDSFDTFVSYKRDNLDQPYIRELVSLLRANRVKVWFDEDELRPGTEWQTAMEVGIRNSRSGVVLLGRSGIGPWQNEEIRSFLQFAVNKNLPVIPVLLPSASAPPDLPLFLSNRMWVDMRQKYTPENIAKLIWGITGIKSSPVPFPASYTPTNIDEYISKKGHLVHKLKAKDSTGRWAYYFVFVEPALEQPFLQALGSNRNIDLEAYGKVIASCYGERPTKEIVAFLKDKYGFSI